MSPGAAQPIRPMLLAADAGLVKQGGRPSEDRSIRRDLSHLPPVRVNNSSLQWFPDRRRCSGIRERDSDTATHEVPSGSVVRVVALLARCREKPTTHARCCQFLQRACALSSRYPIRRCNATEIGVFSVTDTSRPDELTKEHRPCTVIGAYRPSKSFNFSEPFKRVTRGRATRSCCRHQMLTTSATHP